MRRRLLTLILLLVGASSIAQAQPSPHDLVRSALVGVIVEGTDVDHGNAHLAAHGTGFFVGPDGFVVTSFHLRNDLNVDPGTLSFSVVVSTGITSQTIVAQFVDSDPGKDLMLLQIPTRGQNAPSLALDPNPRVDVTLGSTAVYTSGFPAAVNYFVADGKIASFQGPANMLWMWSGDYRSLPGLSGAPVYLADGRVIGVNTGVFSANGAVAYMSPSNWVNRLLGNAPPSRRPDDFHVTVFAAAAPIVETRSIVFEAETTNCASEPVTISDWIARVRTGWEILPTSILPQLLDAHGASRFTGVTEADAAHFSLTGIVANASTCAEGATTSADQPGRLTVRVIYNERRTVATQIVYDGFVQSRQHFTLPTNLLALRSVVYVAPGAAGAARTIPLAVGNNNGLAVRLNTLNATLSAAIMQ